MEDDEPTLTPEDIVEAFKSRALMGLIFSRHKLSEEPQLGMFVELHNLQQIDLLVLVQSPEFQEVRPSEFFTGQQFYTKAIPKLLATTIDMMQSVAALVQKGGADLAANWPNAAFRDWCKADPNRAREVIELAKQGEPLACKFVTFALEASNQVSDAISFVTDYDGERRLAGITALGRMNYPDKHTASSALSTLCSVLGDSDDNLRATALLGSIEIATKLGGSHPNELEGILDRVSINPGPQTIFASARALAWHAKSLDRAEVSKLLDILLSVDPAHNGSIHELDGALYTLIGTSHADLALQFLKSLLVKSDERLALSNFPSFSSEFGRQLGDKFQTTVISWLISGERVLCEGISVLLRRDGRREAPLDLKIDELDLSPSDRIFLCRKALGWLFMQPVIAASILVAVMRMSDDDVANSIQSLISDPLLRNFGGALRTYLEGLTEEDPVFRRIRETLDQADRYLENLKAVGRVKEFDPSDRQRRVQHVRSVEEARDIHRGALQQSVLASLVKRSVILYGKRSVTYFAALDGQRRRVEMDLKPHGFSIDMPRMHVIDPVGLDMMMFLLRVEKRVS